MLIDIKLDFINYAVCEISAFPFVSFCRCRKLWNCFFMFHTELQCLYFSILHHLSTDSVYAGIAQLKATSRRTRKTMLNSKLKMNQLGHKPAYRCNKSSRSFRIYASGSNGSRKTTMHELISQGPILIPGKVLELCRTVAFCQ